MTRVALERVEGIFFAAVDFDFTGLDLAGLEAAGFDGVGFDIQSS
jgi:hypothetical protein